MCVLAGSWFWLLGDELNSIPYLWHLILTDVPVKCGILDSNLGESIYIRVRNSTLYKNIGKYKLPPIWNRVMLWFYSILHNSCYILSICMVQYNTAISVVPFFLFLCCLCYYFVVQSFFQSQILCFPLLLLLSSGFFVPKLFYWNTVFVH